MDKKKVILRRLNFLYFLFLLIIVTVFIHGWDSFKAGFLEGMHAASMSKENKTYEKYFEIPISRTAGKFDFILSKEGNDEESITSRITSIDISNEKRNPAYNKFLVNTPRVIGLLSFMAVFIIILIIFNSLRKSVRNNDVFNPKIIKLTRTIGILLLISAITYDISRYFELKAAKVLLENTGIEVGTLDIAYQDIITGLLIFVIAEVFAIGYNLTQEQKLTI